jgi:CheY-like chemotaxis protein
MPKILLVDDEDSVREVAQTSLEVMAGWDVVAVSSGSEAIRRAIIERPDAILLDVMMPEMDGPATFRELQQQAETRDIPVVLLTAKVQAQDRQRFAELGVAGVITKPFDPAVLHERVGELLGWEV